VARVRSLPAMGQASIRASGGGSREVRRRLRMSTVSSQIEPAQAEKAPAEPGAVRSGALLFAATLVGVGATYLFYLVSGRVLGTSDYGILASLLALTTLIALPVTAIQMAVSREVSALAASGREASAAALTRSVLRAAVVATVALLAVFLALLWPLADLLNLPSVTPLVFVAITIAPAVLIPVFLGELQGRQRFRRLSLATALVPIARFLSLVVFFALGWKLYGALGALALGTVVTCALVAWWCRDLIGRETVREAAVSVRPFLRALVPVMVALLALTALTNVDLLMVKARLSSSDAGIYGAASAFAKVAFFLPTAVVAILFPRVAARLARGRETEDILGRVLAVTVAFCALLFCTYGLIGGFLVRLTYGPEFSEAASLLGLFGIGMSLFSIANVLVSYHLSRHEHRFAWIVAGAAACQVIALALVPADMRTFLWVNAGIGIALVASHELVMGSSVPALRAGFQHVWEELAPKITVRAWLAAARGPMLEVLAVLAGFSLLVVALTWPLAAHMGDSIFGGLVDTIGTIAGLWQQAHLTGYDVIGSTHVANTGAPFGWEQGNGVNVQSAFVYYPAYLLTQAFGEIAAYNLVVLSGLVLSAAAMYWLVRRLTRSPLIATWAGLVYMIFPWHLAKAQAHASLAHLEGFPLLVLAVIAWYRKPGWKSALFLVGSMAILWTTSGYFGLIGLVGLCVALPIAAWYQRSRFGLSGASMRLAGAGGAVLIVPVVVFGIASLGKTAGEIAAPHDVKDLAWFGARIWEYFVPSSDNVVIGDRTYPWLAAHLHQSNFSETSLYVGWLTLLLALGFVIACGVRWRRLPESRRFLCVTLSALVVVAVLFSPPYPISIGSLELPTPPWLLWKIVPQFRVPARFIALLMTALVPLASLALAGIRDRLAGEHTGRARGLTTAAVVLVAAGIGFVELSGVPPATLSRLDTLPREYRLVEQTPQGVLAEYPLAGSGEPRNSEYLFWQRLHERPLLNGAASGSFPDSVRQVLIDPNAAGVAAGLATLGVTSVTLRPDAYQYPFGILQLPRRLGGGYELLGRAEDGASTWKIVAPQAPLAVFTDGFSYTEVPAGRQPSRWLTADEGRVELIAPRAGLYYVHFNALSYLAARRLVVHGSDGVVAFGVPESGVDLWLTMELPDGRSFVEVSAEPGPEPVPGADGRSVSVYMTNWLFDTVRPANLDRVRPIRPFAETSD
jgi:O-antigen/teichoic acid export membrane protein